jgi:Domain of unknown function (DUF222)
LALGAREAVTPPSYGWDMAGARSIGVVQKEIVDLFAELAELDPGELTSGEVVDYAIASQRIRSLADAHCARSAGVVDRSKVWSVDGAKSATAWLVWAAKIARGRAQAAVVGARDLRNMPRTEAAMLAGRITADHLRRLADAQATNAQEFADDEARLVEVAEQSHYSRFDRLMRYWCYYAAPDDGEEAAEARRGRRSVHCSRTLDGMVVIDALLDPVHGEVFARELERLERELFEEDVAEAKARVGAGFALSDLQRDPKQRRADALALMAARSAAKPAGATEPRILLQALVGEDSLRRMCELSNRQVVTPGELLPVLEWADIERIVFESPSRVLDVGVRQRIFRGATRIAVLARHRACVHATCDVPAERCEIDHKVPYSKGGLTIQENGEPKCRYHHRRTPPSP